MPQVTVTEGPMTISVKDYRWETHLGNTHLSVVPNGMTYTDVKDRTGRIRGYVWTEGRGRWCVARRDPSATMTGFRTREDALEWLSANA